jgi:hypothetical protein
MTVPLMPTIRCDIYTSSVQTCHGAKPTTRGQCLWLKGGTEVLDGASHASGDPSR